MTLDQKLDSLPPFLTVKHKGDVDDYARLSIHKHYHNKKCKTWYWLVAYSFDSGKSLFFESNDFLGKAVDQMINQVHNTKIIWL